MKIVVARGLNLLISTSALGLLWAGSGAAQGGPKAQEAFALADRRAPVAQECLQRANAVLEGWLAIRDPETGMMPRTTNQYVWSPGDNAADMYPFLVLSARFTAPERIDELLGLLRTEISLTTRIDGMPDWYSIRERRFQHAKPDIHRIIFAATEYAKDGLNPLIELNGPSPWASRMRQLVDGIIKHSPVDSDFGKLPSNSTEVNGELLQVLTRFYFLTGEERYLEFAERIADAYCMEVLPGGGWLPAHRWDFTQHQAIDDVLSLNDHGNEIVGGLAEVFSAVHRLGRESTARYEIPLRRMFDTLLEKARNQDGLWYSRLRASTAEPLSQAVPDTWGYALAGMLNFGLVTNEKRYWEAARQALKNINQERYLEWGGADSFADSIEGALLLLQHLPEPSGFAWLEQILPRFFAKQNLTNEKGTGIVEGWYGDGNYARTALMVALCYSGGTSMQPWNSGLQLGGATEVVGPLENVSPRKGINGRLHLSLSSEEDWRGRLHFDHPRHADHFRLPHDLPRLNSFPEWYTVNAAELYRVVFFDGGDSNKPTSILRLGAELIAGLPLELKKGRELKVMVIPIGPAPHGREPEPTDPFEMLDATGGDQALIDSVDLNGGESYVGETYRWTKRAAIEWIAKASGVGDSTLWIRWGAKNDERRAKVSIGGHEQIVEYAGFNGFHWLAIDVPMEWWQDDELPIRIEALESGAAFISKMRLRKLSFKPRASSTTRIIEAEDFDGPWLQQDNLEGFSGTGFRVSNADGVAGTNLTTSIDLPPGNYQIWTRGYEGNDQDRRFSISLGDRRFAATHKRLMSDWNASTPRPSTTGFSWRLAAHVKWKGGTAKLSIHDAGTGFEVADCVMLTTDQSFDPGAKERLQAILQAAPSTEDAVSELIEQCSASAERAHELIASRQDTPENWRREKKRLQGKLSEALGLSPLPRRTPLNIRLMGTLQRDGYSIEKIVFDSRPGFPVTANVYVPNGPGPFPIVLNPVGHWGKSKAEPVVQSRCIGLAKQGYLALTYDAFGQGERAVPGNSHYEYFRSILVGQNNMSFMVWDTMRALDYLLQRDDADGSRIACTGASGGGLNTLYAAAMDERIGVAIPVVYLTRFREFLETKITHCPCSHVNGLASFMDMGDVAGLIAPRPLMAITASKDPSFTPKGAEAAILQALGAYKVCNAENHLQLREFDAPHDYNHEMRESLYGFLAKHLKGASSSDPIPEPALEIENDPSDLNCYDSGKVPENMETVKSLSALRARNILHQGKFENEMLFGKWGLNKVPAASVQFLDSEDSGTAKLRVRAGVPRQTRKPVLFSFKDGTSAQGWQQSGDEHSAALVIVVSSTPIQASTLLAAAETSNSEFIFIPFPQTSTHSNLNLLATDSLLLGESLFGKRCRKLVSTLRALRDFQQNNKKIIIVTDNQQAKFAVLLAQRNWKIADTIVMVGNAPNWIDLFQQPLPSVDEHSWRFIEMLGQPQWISEMTIPILSPSVASAEEAIRKLLNPSSMEE
jgi:dienelactone hydrolase